MEKSWTDKLGLSQVTETAGSGTLVGGAIGAGLALIGAFSGLTSGWLGWLMVPALAVAGAAVGDFVKKDGIFFGPEGYMPDHAKQAENDYLSAIYLERNPDVRDALLSGESVKNGQYKTAREHWFKYGKAEGREWPSKDKLPKLNAPLNQSCDISTIPVGKDGKVTVCADDFIGRLLDSNDAIVFGDWRHENPAIPDFLKKQVPVMKAKGVTDVFLETGKEQQKLIDEYYCTGDEKLLHTLSLLHRDQQSNDCSELVKACKEAGIRVHCMDDRTLHPMGHKAYWHKDEFIKEHGEAAYKAAVQYVHYQRGDAVNQHWVDSVKANARGKYILLGGSAHLEGFLPIHNIDEMLAEQRNEKVVNVGLSEIGSEKRLTPEIISHKSSANPHKGSYDPAEFYVLVPGLHAEAYEAARKSIAQDLSPTQTEALKKQIYDTVNDAMNLRLEMVEKFKFAKKIESEDKAKEGAYYKLMEAHMPIYYQLHAGKFDEAAKGYETLVAQIDKDYPAGRPVLIEAFRERALKLKAKCESLQNCVAKPETLAIATEPLKDLSSDDLLKEGKLLASQHVTGKQAPDTKSGAGDIPLFNVPEKPAEVLRA